MPLNISAMSGRSRGRANPNQDADEERRLWKEIKDRAKEVDSMVVSRLPLTLQIHIHVDNMRVCGARGNILPGCH